MNPRGPPGTPMDIETFPQNSQIKSMERTPLQSLTYLYKIKRKRSEIFFFFFSFLLFFKHLDFSENLARVSSVFRTFPNLQNLIKAFKNIYKLQFYTSILGLFVHNPINTIYIHIHLSTSNHQNIQTFLNSMHIFIKTIWA